MILAEDNFTVQSTHQMTKATRTGQKVSGEDTTLPIIYIEDWKYICQRKQGQIEKCTI